MNRNSSAGSLSQRPLAFSTKSFTRFEPSSPNATSKHRHRASTLNTPAARRKSHDEEHKDVFNKAETQEDEPVSPDLSRTSSLPEKFDELPIELASSIDRFAESLGTKSWEQPPSIEQISDLFQDFYITASSRISTHISTLISRLNREPSPKPAKTLPKSRTLASKKSSDSLMPDKTDGAQQMLTATEVTEKRKARKLLEYKRILLEEAVERRACEKVYGGLWRHKSTLDEVRDEKLRSKTAALALVGIGLKDLGIELDTSNDKSVEDVQELLAPARDGLIRMNDEHYPLGKLQHLTTAHKAIVDTLYSIHGSSSSADEILPTLIYTLITSPVEGINIISNLNFIQRFRASSKIDGESAYCMTNLEAAISFLENVDLSSLRDEERPEGPQKTPSQPGTPTVERLDPFPTMPVTTTTTSTTTATSDTHSSVSSTNLALRLKTSTSNARPPPSPRHQRTLSDLLQPVTAANEVVRNTAKEGIETISNTLDNSFKFLFGRLKEHAGDPTSPKDVIVPKTLDEARQLVSRPIGADAAEEAIAASETSSIAERESIESPATDKPKAEDKLLSLFGGRKPVSSSIRDRSVDSQKSNASGSRRLQFSQSNPDVSQKTNSTPTSSTPQSTPLESVKNIGSSLNPLSHIGNAFGSGFRGFGRPAMPTSATLPPSKPADTPAPALAAKDKKPENIKENIKENDSQASFQIPIGEPESLARKIREVRPPILKFVDMDDMNALKVGEIQELLDDYKRLAGLLGELANVSKQ